MQFIEPVLFGAVQGIAEFLPISSSGHLLLLHSVTHYSVGSDLTFDVALHFGTLIALMAYFWKDLGRIFVAWLKSFKRWNVRDDVDQRLGWLLVISSIPGIIVGASLATQAETVFRQPALTALVLIIAGLMLWAADRYVRQRDGMENLTWKHAILIGLAQTLAIVPGVSRSGITITLGRLMKLSRDTAARFSFLMSAPILAGAGLHQLYGLRHESFSTNQLVEFTIGVLVAAAVGYIAIRFLLRYISKHSYSVFMWYRLALGTVTLLVIWWVK